MEAANALGPIKKLSLNVQGTFGVSRDNLISAIVCGRSIDNDPWHYVAFQELKRNRSRLMTSRPNKSSLKSTPTQTGEQCT